MPPRPYYKIDPDRYLFSKSNETPEEKIRQWALYELLSTYGIDINSIEIERSVKVGTRTYRADIVVHREGAPYVIIECKRWKNKNIDKGIDQAISYADANTIKAKFAVFTNGDIWRVKRKMLDEWVDIPDIGRKVDSSDEITIDALISNIHEFEPVLYWYDYVVTKDNAHAYFHSLQEVFHGRIFPLDYVDRNMCHGTDNLLRVLSARGAHENYIMEKMRDACSDYMEYFRERFNMDNDLFDLNKDNFFYLTGNFLLEFERVVRVSKGLINEEILLLRFILSLFRYVCKISNRQPKITEYHDIPASVNDELHILLDYLFKVRLGMGYPDRLEDPRGYSMRISTERAWISYKKFIDKE